MKKPKPCPICGQPLVEQPKFPGLWLCPDYVTPLNDRPPYQYRCTGTHLPAAGAKHFDAELLKLIVQKN